MSARLPEDCDPPARTRLRLLVRFTVIVGVIAFVAALAASEFVYLQESRLEFDLNSGVYRSTKRHLWRKEETISDTWVSKALNGSNPKAAPNWVLVSHGGRTLWAKSSSTCKFRHVYSANQEMDFFSDHFTPKAREVLATGFLSSLRRPEICSPGLVYTAAFERELSEGGVKLSPEAPAGEKWVRAFHAKNGF